MIEPEANLWARTAVRVNNSAFPALALSLSVVAIFWWVYAVALNSAVLMPSPPAVARRFMTLATTDSQLALWSNTLASVERILIGWGAGVIVGIAVGAAMASSRWISGALDPLIELARPIPPLAFAPLLIVWFGIGELPKDLILFFAAFPILAIATVAAFRGVDPVWKQAAQTLGASHAYMLRRVLIPAALPEIFTGARIASGTAWGSLIAAEIIASSQGLGWMILQAGRYLDTETIFVGIIVIGALAFTMDRLIRQVDRQLSPWRGKA